RRAAFVRLRHECLPQRRGRGESHPDGTSRRDTDRGQDPGSVLLMARKGKVLVGTASWTDKTLIDSGWYPKDAKTPEKRPAHYASQFPLVEVDSTYYALPSERNSVLWVERTPAHFTFNVKAFSLMTQHPAQVRALPKDLREAAPDKRTIYARDLPPEAMQEVFEIFRNALMPLHSAGKLGAIL